jgi:hypothetical protein
MKVVENVVLVGFLNGSQTTTATTTTSTSSSTVISTCMAGTIGTS